MQLDFQPYQAADFAYCNELLESNMQSYFEEEGIIWNPSRYVKELAKSMVWLMYWGENKVGFIHMSERSGNPYLNSIQISSSYRKQGIGSQALNWIESKFKQQSKTHILLSVFKTNPACKLYQRLGYSIEEDRGNKFLMKKML